MAGASQILARCRGGACQRRWSGATAAQDPRAPVGVRGSAGEGLWSSSHVCGWPCGGRTDSGGASDGAAEAENGAEAFTWASASPGASSTA
jgi:hypothetical protein